MYQTYGVSLMILFTIAIAVLIYMLITEKLVFTIYIGILFGAYLGLLVLAIMQAINARTMRKAYKLLATGLPKQKVVQMLGDPDSIGLAEDGAEILHRQNDEGLFKGMFFGIRKREITAIFRDEILVAFDNYAIDK